MHSTRIALDPDKREAMVTLLNARLADAVVLASQLKQAHWNVKGPHFLQLHQFFDGLTDIVRNVSDEIAERAVTLGGTALGTSHHAAEGTRLARYPDAITGDRDHLQEVADRFAQFTNACRSAVDTAGQVGDPITEDLFTAVTREMEKQLWFIEAHLQGMEGAAATVAAIGHPL